MADHAAADHGDKMRQCAVAEWVLARAARGATAERLPCRPEHLHGSTSRGKPATVIETDAACSLVTSHRRRAGHADTVDTMQ
eukprot:8228174-Alexandrium_andersonii.AAC.1